MKITAVGAIHELPLHLNHPELVKSKRIFESFAGAGPYGFLGLKLGAAHCDLLSFEINR